MCVPLFKASQTTHTSSQVGSIAINGGLQYRTECSEWREKDPTWRYHVEEMMSTAVHLACAEENIFLGTEHQGVGVRWVHAKHLGVSQAAFLTHEEPASVTGESLS